MSGSSLISILSTDHGRLRREQRDIRKRDFSKAIRYGTAERTWGRRWKLEYDGIIFIVDDSMSREVTAYPSPLSLAQIDTKERILHTQAKDLLKLKPELCTSHTVLVVDNSGSMTTHDIILHKNRQVAAYSITAMEFVAEQLFRQTATNSDVLTLIEFDSQAREVFSRESFDWVLYNKILNRRDERSFIERQGLDVLDAMYGDTNYIHALDAADRALQTIDHDRCALSLFFLSDGAPTDGRSLGITKETATHRMISKMKEMAAKYGDKLNVHMVGFGASHQDFSIMTAMTEAVTAANSGAKSEFIYCDKAANKIESAVSSLVSSTTMTRTHLLSSDRGKDRTKRNVQLESGNSQDQWNYFPIRRHLVYDTRYDQFVDMRGLPTGSFVGAEEKYGETRLKTLHESPPPYIAINREAFGVGAERIATRCYLATSKSEESFELQAMVAKETNLVQRPDDNVEFHKTFCETQDLASYLALEFNKRLVGLPWYDKDKTPTIAFLPCSILTLDDPDWPERGVLVEKKLNVDAYGWRKYNDNAGGIDGQYYHAPLNIERELQKLDANIDDMILEEEEEESEEESEEEDEGEAQDDNVALADGREIEKNDAVEPTDYVQAFTHFTYLFTARQVMVCDLQGVYNHDLVPPTFELTDPAIHYRSNRGRRHVFGRTDDGEAGMDKFFDTHKCSQVCKMMQLSRKNKNWRKKWRTDNKPHRTRKSKDGATHKPPPPPSTLAGFFRGM
ncbi:MAG: hypothetical protein SGBAC_003155 [Bacillariaceae sp.]